jgi:hypothetical protein
VSETPKQIRFTQLVKASGQPHPATLWVADANKDPEFKKAIAENRILTIHHVNVGNKKESGEIGFQTGGAAGYLIFPKSLPMVEGTRVIGLKFDMLAEVPVKDPVKVTPSKLKPKTEPVKILKFPATEKTEAEQSKPAGAEEKKAEPKLEVKKHELKKDAPKPKPLSRFKITVEYTATATREFEVQARNAAEAIQSALFDAERHAPRPDWQLDAKDVKRCD